MLAQATRRGNGYSVLLVDAEGLDCDPVEFVHRVSDGPHCSLVLMRERNSGDSPSLIMNAGYFCVLDKPVEKRFLFNILHATVIDAEIPANVTRLVDIQSRAASGDTARILVGEDNPTNQKVLRKILEFAGHEVAIAGNGEAVLDLLECESFDVLILDMHMPGLGGLDVVRVLRFGSVADNEIPVIMFTADATPAAQQACRDAGIEHFLTKPVDSTRLLELVQGVIAQAATRAAARAVPDIHGRGPSRPQSLVDRNILDDIAQLSNDIDFMKDLIDGFVSDAVVLINEIRNDIAQRRFEEIHDHTHALKGSARSIGAIELARRAAFVDSHSRPIEWKSLPRHVQDMEKCLDETRDELRNYLEHLQSAAG